MRTTRLESESVGPVCGVCDTTGTTDRVACAAMVDEVVANILDEFLGMVSPRPSLPWSSELCEAVYRPRQ